MHSIKKSNTPVTMKPVSKEIIRPNLHVPLRELKPSQSEALVLIHLLESSSGEATHKGHQE